MVKGIIIFVAALKTICRKHYVFTNILNTFVLFASTANIAIVLSYVILREVTTESVWSKKEICFNKKDTNRNKFPRNADIVDFALLMQTLKFAIILMVKSGCNKISGV